MSRRQPELTQKLERHANDLIDRFNRDAKDLKNQNYLLQQKTTLDMLQAAETLGQIESVLNKPLFTRIEEAAKKAKLEVQ